MDIKKFIIFFSVYLVLLVVGYIIYKQYFSINVADNESGKLLMAELDQIQAQPEHNHQTEADYGYDSKAIEEFQSLDKTINFMSATIIEENEQYFSSLFLPEKLSEALFTYSDDPSHRNVLLKIIKEINRNGKLNQIKWKNQLTEDKTFSRSDQNVNITLIYKDDYQVNLKLNFVLVGTEHVKAQEIYYIENSPIELIKEIQKQIK